MDQQQAILLSMAKDQLIFARSALGDACVKLGKNEYPFTTRKLDEILLVFDEFGVVRADTLTLTQMRERLGLPSE